MSIKNVAIIGAAGKLGPSVLAALLYAKVFTVTVITRESSKSQYGDSVRTLRVPDGLPEDALAKQLEGQDALVVTMAGDKTQEQKLLANACVKAGVKRFIPADFGSVDSTDQRSLKLVPLYGEKVKVRKHLEELSAAHPAFTWTSLVPGHFFDWGLTEGFLHYDLSIGTADILDDGETMFSTSTLPRIGEATAKILMKPEQTANKILYIQSFCVNQFDILEALMRASGQNFTTSFLKSEDYINQEKKKTSAEATENLVYALGVINANWEKKATFANDLLELPTENIDEVVKRVYNSLAQKKAET